MDNDDKDDELSNILEESQKKLDNLKDLKEKEIILENKGEDQKKSVVPGQIQFTKKIKVKELPKKEPRATIVSPKPPLSYIPKETPESSTPIRTPQTNSIPKVKKLKLKPQDIKLNILSDVDERSEIDKSDKPPKLQIKKIEVKNKLDSMKIPERLKDISNQVKTLIGSKEKVPLSQSSDLSTKLQKLIQEKGSSLIPELTAQFINKLSNSIEGPITLDDIKMAANYFWDIEQKL